MLEEVSPRRWSYPRALGAVRLERSAGAWAAELCAQPRLPVRLLRAKNILRPPERPSKPAARASLKTLFGRLLPVAFRLLARARGARLTRTRAASVLTAPGAQFELEPFPALLVDVRSAEEAVNRPLSSWLPARAATVLLPEAELPTVLRPSSTVWQGRFGGGVPEANLTLVFICNDGIASARCASIAANLGFSRCSILEGGLDALSAAAPARVPRCAFVSRNALAALQDRGGLSAEGVLVLDVRRRDERALFGALPGAAHLPCEQLPRALAMGADEWGRTFRFPRPHQEAPLVLHSRGEVRARWASQLLIDEGFESPLVLRDGVACRAEWDADVMTYPSYREGEAPPEPSSPAVRREGADRQLPSRAELEAGYDEAVRLGLLG